MRTPWKPVNFYGQINEDPRDELRARAKRVEEYDQYVSIPISLAFALADLHECDATTVIASDGPMPLIKIYCRRMVNHKYMHSNGYTSWDSDLTIHREDNNDS